MKNFISYRSLSIIVFSFAAILYSCSKGSGGGGGGGGTPNPCAGVTIAVTATQTNPTTGSSNGSINASASGGSSGVTFNINGGAFQSSGIFNNLPAGTYAVIAKDANGCTGSATVTLVGINPCTGVTITVGGTSVNPTSTVTTNGSISATASGSSGFTFNINGGLFQASGNFSNLGVGSYTIVAKDLNGCTGSTVVSLTAPNPCTGVTITVSAVVINNRPCEAPNGSITATGAGGTGPYTYNINGGVFQSSSIFSGLGAAVHSVSAKDANGCLGTANTTVSNMPEGPLFLAVKNLIQANCVSCHSNAISNGGMNFQVDCNIVNSKDRIRERAVNGNPSTMPPTGLLPASERAKITDWINAGGRFTD